MGNYSIKELERLSQVSAHTIRIWERRYALLRPKRSTTNIRAYSDDDLRKLLNVALLNERGLKISRIAELSEDEIEQKVLELDADKTDPQNELESLVMAMADLDEERFERIMANAILRLGFESAMERLVLPFLCRVGVLWQTGRVKPGQEHFVSNLIRQKLIAAIDALVPPARADRRTLLLFLPEGELHELGLLFSQYMAKKAGHRVIYLGQSVPFPDIQALVRRHSPDALVTAFITSQNARAVEVRLRTLSKALPRTAILAHVAGGNVPKAIPARVRLLPDLKSFTDFLV